MWLLYREIMLQNFTGIASIPGINKQGKEDLFRTELYLMMTLLKALREKKLLVRREMSHRQTTV